MSFADANVVVLLGRTFSHYFSSGVALTTENTVVMFADIFLGTLNTLPKKKRGKKDLITYQILSNSVLTLTQKTTATIITNPKIAGFNITQNQCEKFNSQQG